MWIEYPFRKSHPIIRWLPSKLAAWIGVNFGQELQIPPKRDVKWTAGELIAILENNLVPSHRGKGQRQTFGCIQWECELYSGRLKALCYLFNLLKSLFWVKKKFTWFTLVYTGLHPFAPRCMILYEYDIIYDIISHKGPDGSFP